MPERHVGERWATHSTKPEQPRRRIVHATHVNIPFRRRRLASGHKCVHHADTSHIGPGVRTARDIRSHEIKSRV